MTSFFEASAAHPYELTVDGFASNYFRVESFTGTEAVSKAYVFDVVTTGNFGNNDEVERLALGQRAVFTWHIGDEPRAFYGVIGAVRLARAAEGNVFRFHLRVVPRLWLLKRKRRTRVFQKMRVPDVVTSVLLEAGIGTRWQLTRAYPVREYCTQYEESDYAFVTRLLAEAGILFYFAEGPPVDDAAEIVSDVVGVAGAAAGSVVGSVAGSAVGSVVESAASAASPLIPGDTVICADDAAFYPPIGPDDPAALAAATAAAMASEVGEAIGGAVGGMDPIAGAALGGAAAVAGSVIAGVTSDPAPSLHFLEMENTATSLLDKVTRFDLRTTVRANKAAYRDFDPERPMAKLESTALSSEPFPPSALEAAAQAATTAGSMASQYAPGPVGDAGALVAENAGAVATAVEGLTGGNPPPLLEVYDHHGPFLFPKWSFADDEAPRMLRQKRRRVSIAQGASGCPALGSGRRFALADHPVPHLDQPYVVTSVEHRGKVHPRAGATKANENVYENSFECAPAVMTFVPPRPKRRSVQVSLTATVVGPPGVEIHVDVMGQIKVQFHWDRDGKLDDRSSCWIRTMHPWAGASWGVQFIPRVGMEVVVVFEGGDPDKPMVIGSVYNGTHPTPFLLPGDKTRSGFRTQSSPGGSGFNELSFEDSAGKEQVFLHAQRDLEEAVENDHKRHVGKNEDIGVGEDRNLSVGGKAVDNIRGDRSVLVGGNREVAVEGSQITRVSHDVFTSAAENHTLKAAQSSTVVVGTKDAEGIATLEVYGDAAASATRTIQLTAVESIRLVCGKSVVEITPNEIKLDSKALTLSGSSSVSAVGKGPGFHLTDEAILSGKSITIKTPKAQIKLDQDATLKGDTIKLNCDAPAGDEDDAPPPPAPKSFQVIVTDAYHQPLADKAYQLVVEGVVLEGTTSGDGRVEQDVSPTALSGELTVFLEKKGESPKLVFPLKLSDVPPVDTPIGMRTRLKNLGYQRAGAAGEGDGDAGAVRAFQRDHGLPESGEFDEATRAKLTERHGH
jgi:type VI secretion system secreted protein VgrG